MRGLHYQSTPHEEVKLVRCTDGAIYDVIVDLRPASTTYCQYVGIMHSADNRRTVYIPKCCAHGFLTLEQNSEVSYLMSEFHVLPMLEGFDGMTLRFKLAGLHPLWSWSEKDRTWPAFLTNGDIVIMRYLVRKKHREVKS